MKKIRIKDKIILSLIATLLISICLSTYAIYSQKKTIISQAKLIDKQLGLLHELTLYKVRANLKATK
jgi:hypothetical protein